MVVGILAALAAVAGLVYGIVKKNTRLAIWSGVVLVLIAIIGTYFAINPY